MISNTTENQNYLIVQINNSLGYGNAISENVNSG